MFSIILDFFFKNKTKLSIVFAVMGESIFIMMRIFTRYNFG